MRTFIRFPLGLLWWEYTTSACHIIIVICWEDLSFHMPVGSRLQSWNMLSPESRGEIDCSPWNKVGEELSLSLACQKRDVPSFLSVPHTGEWMSTGSLPKTGSWILSEAGLAGGCRTRLVFLVQGCISLPPAAAAHMSFTKRPAAWRDELCPDLLSAERDILAVRSEAWSYCPLVAAQKRLPRCRPEEAAILTGWNLQMSYLPIRADTTFL